MERNHRQATFPVLQTWHRLSEQADMLHELFPDAKNVGMLYCSAEANSEYQVDVITEIPGRSGIYLSNITALQTPTTLLLL